MQSTVLVLGARGRFGLAAARAFADAGWRVKGLLRPEAQVPQGANTDALIEWLKVDLHDTAAVVRAAKGADVVVHALNPVYTHKAWRAQALSMTQAALRIAQALDATLMFMGNVYNFGVDMPPVLTEDTPQRAVTVKGRIRIAMEEQMQRSGVRTIVIRAGDFFGSGRGTWFDQAIVKNLQKGKFTYPGRSNIATAWAYLPDLAETFVKVAEHRSVLKPFEVFHFSGHTVSGQQWLDAVNPIARAQGWVGTDAEVRNASFPWKFIRLGAPLVATWKALLEMRYLWDTAHTLDNRKLVALLGEEPHTPLNAALLMTLRDLGYLRNMANMANMGTSE